MTTATPKTKATPTQRIKMRIRKGDTVQVITGKEKGKTGEVLRTLPIENRVIVEGINVRTRHVKPTQEGESGRIVTEEASVHASNVMLYSTNKKVASRVALVVEKDGSKKRRLKKTGELID
ncbi:MAG: 50S ribosomal protein L24 [Prochlorococcus sp.]|jgi:large subunit ribosomal protein L24|tara:strand:- start:596 stop:958 length:363 start_codon:yes stop_codon:yes gene_type:complete